MRGPSASEPPSEAWDQLSQTERALDESNQRYRSLFDYFPHAAFSLDADGVFVDANEVARELSGYSLEEFRQVDFTHLVVPEDLPRALDAFAGALAREPQKLTATMLTKSGATMELNLAVVPVIVGNEVVGVHGTAEDVSEENAMRRELERTRRAAEEANASKSLFLANMSHEVRTPLTSVLGATELLSDGDLDPSQQHLVDIVRRSGEKLLRLVNDILDVSRLEVGTLDVAHAAFSIVAVLDDVLAWAQPIADREELDLVVAVDPRVPERLVGDAFRVQQVLTNLLGNALKFTENGSVTLRADLLARGEHHVDVRFEVADTGIGMPGEQLPGLFESFTQADTSTTRKYGGAGLGLAICRELVLLMDGTIEAASSPGEGSTFTVVLPLGLVAGP